VQEMQSISLHATALWGVRFAKPHGSKCYQLAKVLLPAFYNSVRALSSLSRNIKLQNYCGHAALRKEMQGISCAQNLAEILLRRICFD